MGKQQPLYRVNEEEETNSAFENRKNTFTYFNIRETQKLKSIHAHFYVNGLIFLHSNIGKINFLSENH